MDLRRSAVSSSKAVDDGGVDEPAPLLMRHAMPDEWRCVLAIPAAEPGLSGGAETAAFARLIRLPLWIGSTADQQDYVVKILSLALCKKS